MIKSFKNKETETIWQGLKAKKLPSNIQNRAWNKLKQLNASNTLNDLRSPPSNHLEVLKGNRKGQMSIRINNKWRICFKWKGNEAWNVEIVDYH